MLNARIAAAAALLFSSALIAGCADPITCGTDTVRVGNECRPQSLVKCGAGTRLEGSDCVLETAPLSCGPGTVAQDGACVPEKTLTCGAGTEELDGKCVTIDPFKRVTVPEIGEPNVPPGKATRFAVPAIGAAPVVLGGTIHRIDQNGADLDGFIFRATALSRLKFEPLAIGTPTIGFTLAPCVREGADVCEIDQAKTFNRYALTIEARQSGRELVIPYTGDYLMIVSDLSNLTGGLPLGDKSFSYTIDVTQLPQPAPSPLEVGTPVTGKFDTLTGHSFEVTADAPLYDLTLDEQPDADPFVGTRALWAVDATGRLAASTEDPLVFGTTVPMKPVRALFAPGTAKVFVDYVYALLDMPSYRFTATRVDVTRVNLETPYEALGTLAGDGSEVYSLDVTGGSVLRFELVLPTGTQVSPRLELRDAAYNVVASNKGDALARYVGVAQGGRYYLVVSDATFDATKTSLRYTLKVNAAAAATVGPVSVTQPENLAAQTVPASGESWYAIFAANDAVLTVVGTPDAAFDVALDSFVNGTEVRLTHVDGAGTGGAETTAPRFLSSGGVQLVRITGPAGATFGLTATALSAAGESEPNDTDATATPVVFDATGHALVFASFSAGADKDHFLIQVTQPATLTAQTGPAVGGPNLDTVMRLSNGSGARIGYDDDSAGGGFSRITQALQPGAYVIRVEMFGGSLPSGSAAYQLSLSLQ